MPNPARVKQGQENGIAHFRPKWDMGKTPYIIRGRFCVSFEA